MAGQRRLAAYVGGHMRNRLIGLMSIVALLSVPGVAEAASPGLNGKIAFSDYNPGNEDIWVMQPDATGRTAITGPPGWEQNPVWSPDGTRIAFVLDADIHVMNADGSSAVNLTPGTFSAERNPTWSPDGSQIAFTSSREAALGFKIFKMDADGSDVVRVTDGVLTDDEADWSPDGLRIAFVRNGAIYTIKPDGSDLQPVIAGSRTLRQLDWSPSGHRIAYQHPGSSPSTTGIHTVEPDGSNDVDLAGFLNEAQEPVWSPDGTKILAKKGLHLWTMSPDGSGVTQLTTSTGNYFTPDWQPLPFPGYPRPRGATPLRASLVPAFAPCASPDRTHGPPLAFGSCSGPDQTSPHLTVGTPDANGTAANSIGSVRMRVAPGAPGPPSDTQVWIDFEMTDVRCAAATTTCGNTNTAGGPDYTGELELQFTFQATDKLNGPSDTENATMTDYTFHMPEPCSQTADVSTGAHCGRMNFSMDAVVPGIVLSLEGKRAIWQLGQVQVYDGGADGEADTTGDNSLFAVQGLFVP